MHFEFFLNLGSVVGINPPCQFKNHGSSSTVSVVFGFSNLLLYFWQHLDLGAELLERSHPAFQQWNPSFYPPQVIDTTGTHSSM
jgi:hypothetical protein